MADFFCYLYLSAIAVLFSGLAMVFIIKFLRQKKNMAAMEEAKNVLKIRINAKNKQLDELTEVFEEELGRRTKDLQGRVFDLEKFNRLTIGREEKMIELKREIGRLKGESSK